MTKREAAEWVIEHDGECPFVSCSECPLEKERLLSCSVEGCKDYLRNNHFDDWQELKIDDLPNMAQNFVCEVNHGGSWVFKGDLRPVLASLLLGEIDHPVRYRPRQPEKKHPLVDKQIHIDNIEKLLKQNPMPVAEMMICESILYLLKSEGKL